jgi:PelA/Pel-15E family pectate lyase
MKRAFRFAFVSFLGVASCLLSEGSVPHKPEVNSLSAYFRAATTPIKWEDCLHQTPEWYRSRDATRIADNVLLYQRKTGGWPKNIDMAAVLTEKNQAGLARQKQEDDATIDNGATYTQLIFLARIYDSQKLERHKGAFLEGLDYLLRAQYANGGWPQYYPLRKGYYAHITYNDNAMIGVMKLLRDISKNKPVYAFVDETRRRKAEEAVQLGIACILRTQILVAGKRTVWCAQHDEVTLAPAAARKFEPISLSGYESVAIVRFLMGIDYPDFQVTEAIESAIAWFEKSKITGISWIEKRDPSKSGSVDRVVVKEPNAAPLWARFYEIGTNRPIFAGRDSIIKYDVAEIEAERRNGYQWYVTAPAELLNRDYPAWKKQMVKG